MYSNNPSDWEFCILPKEHWDVGPTAFINPIKADGSWDQTAQLTPAFDAALSAIDGYESTECHIELTSIGAKPDTLRQFLLSQGMKENKNLFDD